MFLFPTIMIPNDKFFRPPLLYDLMNSIVNFGKEDKTKIVDLSGAARERIFNFSYPLSAKVNKADFETMILNKFIMRRIGYETFTAWQIQLNVKLNEIMPYYNKLFDSFEDWNLFNDGENYRKTSISEREKEGSGSREKSGENEREMSDNSTVDSRYSKLPQNEIQNVKDGSYMTDYSLGTNNSTGSENSNFSENESNSNNENESQNMTEEFSRDVSNKIEIYNSFIENRNKIMSMIFEELDSLFYGLANY